MEVCSRWAVGRPGADQFCITRHGRDRKSRLDSQSGGACIDRCHSSNDRVTGRHQSRMPIPVSTPLSTLPQLLAGRIAAYNAAVPTYNARYKTYVDSRTGDRCSRLAVSMDHFGRGSAGYGSTPRPLRTKDRSSRSGRCSTSALRHPDLTSHDFRVNRRIPMHTLRTYSMSRARAPDYRS
jgi:hypothetical protein